MSQGSANRAGIVVVAGVSGSGKSTVGQLLARRLGWQFTDGDSLHPASNIAKMASGHPLTDGDRAPWLRRIGESVDARLAAGRSSVIACSALKRAYRDYLLANRPAASVAFLLVDYDVAVRRLSSRRGHFFDVGLLGSQFADLEPPGPDEGRVLSLAAVGRPEDSVGKIIGWLGLAHRTGDLDPGEDTYAGGDQRGST